MFQPLCIFHTVYLNFFSYSCWSHTHLLCLSLSLILTTVSYPYLVNYFLTFLDQFHTLNDSTESIIKLIIRSQCSCNDEFNSVQFKIICPSRGISGQRVHKAHIKQHSFTQENNKKIHTLKTV